MPDLGADMGWTRYEAGLDDRCVADERGLDVECDDCPFQVECGRPNTGMKPDAAGVPAGGEDCSTRGAAYA